MSLVMGQANVPGNSTVQVFVLPPGTVNTTFYQPAPATATVFIGTSANVTVTNGMRLTNAPVTVEQYVSSGSTPVWATTGNATAASFQYVISGGG